VGVFILRRQKITALEPMMRMMQTGQPISALPNVNFCAVLMGILWIIPGFISDILALCLWIPFVQKTFCSKCMGVLTRRATACASRQKATIIQGDFKKKID
jgi:UPF0716 family protein affecting phage T7 exclusion